MDSVFIYKMRNEKTYVYNHPSSRTDGEKSAGNQGNHTLIRFQKNICFSPESFLYERNDLVGLYKWCKDIVSFGNTDFISWRHVSWLQWTSSSRREVLLWDMMTTATGDGQTAASTVSGQKYRLSHTQLLC